MIGDSSAAPAVAEAAGDCREPLASVAPDDEAGPKTDQAELCRLAMYWLVRLKTTSSLRGWYSTQRAARLALVADRISLQRVGDKRGAPALVSLAATEGVYTAHSRCAASANSERSRAVPIASGIVGRPNADIRLRVAAVRALGQLKTPRHGTTDPDRAGQGDAEEPGDRERHGAGAN